MTGRAWTLVAGLSLLALAACSDKKSGGTASPPVAYVGLTLAPSTPVIADGSKNVTVSFTNTGGGQASISTTLGTFQSTNSNTVQTTEAAGNLTLLTCAGCAGTATVTITAPAGTASKSVEFVTRATACQANCAADANCGNLRCTLAAGGFGVCAAGTCTAGTACTPTPAGATTETCSDGIDNNCDGELDCAAASCDGQACNATDPKYQCRNKVCADVSTSLSVTVMPARTRLPAVAGAAMDVEVVVTSGPDPASAFTVSVSLSDATLGTIAPPSAVTGANGRAHFTFTAAGAAGTEVITAGLATVPSVGGSAIVTIPRLASLRLLTDSAGSAQYAVMGAKGSGWQDLGWLKVQALDDLGLPYPDGLPVRYEHRQLGGARADTRSTLGVPLTADTATCRAAEACVGYQAVTASNGGPADSAGVAQAWIYSGTVAGTLPVTASAAAAGASFSVQLPTITVIGARASGANFSVVCAPRNVPALAETNCAISLVDAPFTCQAILKDRFGNVLGRETPVIFVSEASAVGQVVSTPAFTGSTSSAALGRAEQVFQTLGNGLPFDVDPIASIGEVGVVHALDGCGPRTHNPRDGVVTVIAIADGEEAWWDVDGNGTMDPGIDPFVDLGEPFVDQDDDGIWTPGEWFLDLDGNGTWTGPNGRWDANTKIWTQTFVVYTGASQGFSIDPTSATTFLGTRLANYDTFVDACTGTTTASPFDVAAGATPGTWRYRAVASDLNLNFLSRATTYAASIRPATAALTSSYGGLASYADLPGMDWQYWPCANNGAGPCASQCRGSGPCLMRGEFTGFSCGLTTWVEVTGGATPSSGTLNFTTDVTWSEYKNSYTQHGGVAVPGSSH